jgi:transcriptional regulator with XRE-family HTH domain
MQTFSTRLRSERKRLALTQAEIARRCGVSREIWCRYEQGKNLPGCKVMQAFLNAGGNVSFVFSGSVRTEETWIIERFRVCPKPIQEAILRALRVEHRITG